MKTKTVPKTPKGSESEPTCFLRWVFYRGAHSLTCAIEVSENRSGYDLCILPHWDLSASTVERFDAPAGALQRHAEVTLRLREVGWATQYGDTVRRAA